MGVAETDAELMAEPLSLTDGQWDAVEWMQEKSRGLLPLPVGYGKTIIALTYINSMTPFGALLFSTKHIVEHTWPDEIEKWGIPLTYASASGPMRKREKAIESQPDILGVSFENIAWYHRQSDTRDRKILVLDESSKMKSPGAQRVRAAIRNADRYGWAFALSATPAPEGMMGLWSQFASITPERPLGNLTQFRTSYFDMRILPTHTEYIPKKDAVDRFSDAVRHLFYTPKREPLTELGLPAPRHIEYMVEWPSEKAFEQYKTMREELVLDLSDEELVEADSAGVLQNKLRQMASGFVYDGDEVIELEGYHDKIAEMAHFVDNVADRPVLCFTQFLEEAEQIKAAFPDAHIGLPSDLGRWDRGDIPIMVLNPKSAAHGLNLQHGSSIVLFYSLPWSAEEYEQAIGRLQRRGQTSQVTVARFTRRGSIESRVWRKIQEKLAAQDEIMESIHG